MLLYATTHSHIQTIQMLHRMLPGCFKDKQDEECECGRTSSQKTEESLSMKEVGKDKEKFDCSSSKTLKYPGEFWFCYVACVTKYSIHTSI